MSDGPIHLNELDAGLKHALRKLTDKEWHMEVGEWGHLPNEPCRFCHIIGGVYFRADDSPLDKNASQVVRCKNCGRDWECNSPLA